jgi:WD repeat and SOF domain-containing protein 1
VFLLTACRWKPFDPTRNFPDLGPRFLEGERIAHLNNEIALNASRAAQEPLEKATEDKRDLDWATVLKRTFEAYIRGETPNMYGEWLQW